MSARGKRQGIGQQLHIPASPQSGRDSTKELASQFSLASTQAKLFGSTTDQLKAKQQELTAKIKTQKEITSLHHTEVERLTKVLSDQKSRQQELAAQLQTTKAAYEAEKKATGENSDSTQELAKTGARPGKPTEKAGRPDQQHRGQAPKGYDSRK